MQTYEPQTHCHRCGTAYVRADETAEWPRRCPNCENLQWANPTPIGVMLQRVTDGNNIGIATPIRGHAPMRGHPAITGGFTDIWDQSSEDAGSREIHEEIRLARLAMQALDDVELITTQATGPFIPGRRQLLVFTLSPVIVPVSAFDTWEPDHETMAMHYSWEPEVLAFPSHTRALALYFQRHHSIASPAQYIHQPRTGDLVDGNPIFDIVYEQPMLNAGIWLVRMEDGGQEIGVIACETGWRRA